VAVQYDVNAGLDISALSSVSQAQLMQMVQQLAPLSNIGGVLFQSTTPDVANNARFARYLWLDSTTNPPVPKYYNSGTLTWTAVSVSALSITNAEIAAAAAIAITKLAVGTARYVFRTNAAGTANELVTPASIFNSDELGVVKLTSNGGTDGYLKSSGGVTGWVSNTTERAAIAAALSGLSPTVLTPGSNNTLLGTNGAGAVGFAAIGSILSNNAIGLNLLAGGGGTSGDILKFDGSNWVKVTPSIKNYDGIAINSGTISGSNIATKIHTIPHGLGSIPKLVHVRMRMTNAVADIGYNQNDEVDILGYATTSQNVQVTFCVDATNVTVLLHTTTGLLPDKAVGTYAGIDETKWFPVVYAWK
jgi:hypothetical protein